MKLHEVNITLDGAKTEVTIDGHAIRCLTVRVDAEVREMPIVLIQLYAKVNIKGQASVGAYAKVIEVDA